MGNMNCLWMCCHWQYELSVDVFYHGQYELSVDVCYHGQYELSVDVCAVMGLEEWSFSQTSIIVTAILHYTPTAENRIQSRIINHKPSRIIYHRIVW